MAQKDRLVSETTKLNDRNKRKRPRKRKSLNSKTQVRKGRARKANPSAAFSGNITGLFTNADTLTNKMAELQLRINIHKPHIIGINEVLPKFYREKIYPEQFAIKDYEMVPHPNIEANKGRGSVLYIHKSIKFKEVKFNTSLEEGIFAEIKLKGNDTLLCACIYRRGESSEENNDILLETLRKISEGSYSHVAAFGDFNYGDIDWENCTCTKSNINDPSFKFIECIRDCFFHQHVKEATRQRGSNEPSTLDLLFTNDENMVTNLEYLSPLGRSDHTILKFTLTCYAEEEAPKIRVSYDRGNYTKFNEIMQNIDWEEKFSSCPDDVDEQFEIFETAYKAADAECVPRKRVYINGTLSKKFSIPLDKKNLLKIKSKNKQWGRVRKGIASEEEQLGYNKIRNQVRSLTRKAKVILERNIAKNAKSNSKHFWRYVQSKSKTRPGIPDLKKPDVPDIPHAHWCENKPVFTKNDQEKSDLFADYFDSVFTKEPDGAMPNFEKRNFEDELCDIDITEDMVLKKFKKLKINKSPGPDQMHPRVLKEISLSILKPVTKIFQTSIRTKTVPAKWKHANVSAIFKKGKKILPENYRPVSLTSVLCKTLESIIRDQIIDHMTKNKLFSDKQFGFIAGRSTTLQLLHVMNIWTEILDLGGALDVVYCDFMKAFDKVPHRRLIHKIENYGITGNILGWIDSFLSDRTQCININQASSKTTNVTSGIPQGSVLGPILFVLYINDLPEVVSPGTWIYLFADDTKIFRQIRSQDDRNILQNDVSKMVEWSHKWLLKFHPDKCVYMSMGNTNKFINSLNEVETPYTMGDHPLEYSKCEKDLGVNVDHDLKFDKHINAKVNIANRNMGIVKRTFEFLDHFTFCNVFKGLVRPHLEYAAPVWNPYTCKQIESVENVQRRATRYVPGLKDLEYPERLRALNLPTLAFRRARGDMITVYKMLNEQGVGFDKSLPQMLTLSHTNHLRGHNLKLYAKNFNKDIGKYSFQNRMTNVWNSLPSYIVNSKDILSFEINLDKYWKDQPMIYDYKAKIEIYK